MRNFEKEKNLKEGFGLLETVISIAVISLVLFAFISLVTQVIKIDRVNAQTFKANMYAKELIEAARHLEAEEWSQVAAANCASPNVCHVEINSGSMDLVSGEEDMGDTFTRHITIDPVYRDASGSVAETGMEDTRIKKVTSTVYQDGESLAVLETYIYNYE